MFRQLVQPCRHVQHLTRSFTSLQRSYRLTISVTSKNGPRRVQVASHKLFSTSFLRRAPALEDVQQTPNQKSNTESEYRGPLAPTFRKLKIFSLTSLGLSFTLAPFMFLVESSLPTPARFALAFMAIGTSGLSTALVSWCGKPYVATLRRLKPQENDGVDGLELTTLSLLLKPRITRVYDPDFLVDTKRPFAKWELAEKLVLPTTRNVQQGEEETIAETMDKDGHVLGRWVVKWGENGEGVCHEVGNVIRYFNVHQELLT